MKKLSLGLMIKWPKGSLNSKTGNVIGDELLAESLCAAINKHLTEWHAELYASNHLPKSKLEAMIYLNDIRPKDSYAKYHILYLQNGGYGEGAQNLLDRLRGYGYDGYIFFSKKLLDLHIGKNGKGLFLPFGVDMELFRPMQPQFKYQHEVAYVGNDIKGESASSRYLLPAANFEFGLYGNWDAKSRFKIWKNWKKPPLYKEKFKNISRGKIPQSDVPTLYSSAKINLNCTLQDCIDWDVITLRTYEVLACKGFLISDLVPIAEQTMKDCLVFTEGDEFLHEQIAYYLGHENERREIAENGYEYVVKNGSVGARAKEMVYYLEEIIK